MFPLPWKPLMIFFVTYNGWIMQLQLDSPDATILNVAQLAGSPQAVVYWPESGSLYMTDTTSGDVVGLDLVTEETSVLFDGSGAPWGLAVMANPDPMLYWTDAANAKIQRLFLSAPSQPDDVVTTGLFHPVDLYLDTVHDLMFIADGDASAIKVASLDGGDPFTLIAHSSSVLSIAGSTNPDPTFPSIWFGDEEGVVWRADLDATPPNLTVLQVVQIADGFYGVHGLALDEDNDRLLVSDGIITQMDTDGSDRSTLVLGVGVTEGLVLAELLPGDQDLDGDVDLGDSEPLADCLMGPMTAYPAGCLISDFDSDGDVDMGEFAAFQLMFARFTNRLANSGFEDGVVGPGMADWLTFGNVYTEDITPRSGTQVAKLFGNFTGGFNDTGMFQEFPAEPGSEWTFRVFSRHNSGDELTGSQATGGNWVVMKIVFRDTDGVELPGAAEATILDGTFPTDVWIDHEPITATAPAGTVEVEPFLIFFQPAMDGGAVLLDDAWFSRLN
jgi:hypothetical protein